MISINKILYSSFFLILIFASTNVESKILTSGNPDAKVTVKYFHL